MPKDADSTPDPDTRTRARQRIADRRAAEAAARDAAARKRRKITAALTAPVVATVVVAGVLAVQTMRTPDPADAATPANVTGGAFTIGAGAPIVVEVYEDFLCPVCGRFESETGDTLEQLADDGAIELRYRPIAILDHQSPDNYSTRSLNTAAVVADAAGIEAFQQVHDALYAQQPTEGGPGLSDDELVALAADAGATDPGVGGRIRDLRFEDWSRQVTEQASRDGVSGTPTVLVDGQPLTDRTPEGLTAAVHAAQAGA